MEQLTGSATVLPVRAGGFQEGSAARVTTVFRGYVTLAGGQLRAEVSREDTTTGRTTESFRLDESPRGGVLGMADALARRIEPAARPRETSNIEALKALVEGKASNDPAAAHSAYERALTADPDFGAAYVAYAQTRLLRGDRAGATAVVEKGRRRGRRLPELRRAELDLLWATLLGNSPGRRAALLALSRLTPADPDVLRSLGREEHSAQRYGAAVDCYRKAILLDPLSVPPWNQLLYAEAFHRNLAGARSAFAEYRRLAPNDANPFDSLADAHYYLGAFADAEKYYLQAYEKAPSFMGSATLYKAARARLMTGDIRGADQIHRRYREARRKANDIVAGYVDAQWLYVTGQRAEAIRSMRALASAPAAPRDPSGEVAALAESQLAAWVLAEGRHEEAARLAEGVLRRAQAPLARRTASLVRILADPAMSLEMPEGGVKRLWESYRLLMAKRYQEAANLLTRVTGETDPLAQEQAGILLAWARVECGRADLAAPWLEAYGVPQPGLEPSLGFLTFPRIFLLRSVVLEKQGRSKEAAQAAEIYRKLSGS
jgi:tetratricopeptide (TPR) repeat protein